MSKNRHKGYKYKNWQQAVFNKGNHRCAICGSIDNLTADHIKPVATYPELIYEVSNGRVLCNNCRVKDRLEGRENRKFSSRGRLLSM